MRSFAVDCNVRLQETMLFVAEASLFCRSSSQWPPALYASSVAEIACRLEQRPTPDCVEVFWGATAGDLERAALQRSIHSQVWSLLLRSTESPLSGRASIEKFSCGGLSGVAARVTAAAVAMEYGSKAAGLSQADIEPIEGAGYVGLRTWNSSFREARELSAEPRPQARRFLHL